MSTIGENIKKCRIERGMTQKKLSELLNVSQNAVHNWENGKREPKLDTLAQIAKVLNIKLGQLYTDEYIEIENYTPPVSLKEMMEHTTTIKTENKTLLALATSFTKLNEKGQEKAASYVEDLTKIPEYKKTE